MLNESSISGTPLAIGYRATIYLGRWALGYTSNETVANWEYRKINTNRFDNRGGKAPAELTYSQEQTSKIKGGLTAKVPKAEDVKNMMMLKAMEKQSCRSPLKQWSAPVQNAIRFIKCSRKNWEIYTPMHLPSMKKEKSPTAKCTSY